MNDLFTVLLARQGFLQFFFQGSKIFIVFKSFMELKTKIETALFSAILKEINLTGITNFTRQLIYLHSATNFKFNCFHLRFLLFFLFLALLRDNIPARR